MPSKKNRSVAFAPRQNQGPSDVVYFFHLNGCHHCKAMQKAWDDLVSSEIPSVSYKQIEASEIAAKLDKQTQKKLQTDQFQGYPEVRMLTTTGKLAIYSGDRSLADMTRWVKQNKTNTSRAMPRMATPAVVKGGTRRPGRGRSSSRRRARTATRRRHRRVR